MSKSKKSAQQIKDEEIEKLIERSKKQQEHSKRMEELAKRLCAKKRSPK